jgi:hypothetical protein
MLRYMVRRQCHTRLEAILSYTREATLTGDTTDGKHIEGTGTVTIVPGGTQSSSQGRPRT